MKLLSCKLESRNLILFNDKGGKLIFSHLKSMVGTCILNWDLKTYYNGKKEYILSTKISIPLL